MRTLLLLRGAPGAGKSTWIKENNLEQYTIEADKFRTLIANPVLTEDGTFAITQKNDKMAWDLLFKALESRMQRGDFTIVDATHSNENMFRKYKGLAETYRYKVYYKQIDATLEELKERNETREEHKRVPFKAVERVHALITNTTPQTFAQKIDDISEIINYWTEDLTGKYKSVKIIGDIQGCYTVLNEALGELDPEIKYIFAGDILDRGIENKEVLDFMLSIYNKPNVVFIEGNHDEHLRNWALDSWPLSPTGKPRVPREFKYKTLNQLLGAKSKADFTVGIDGDVYTINGQKTKVKVFERVAYDTETSNEVVTTSTVITDPYIDFKNRTVWLQSYKGSIDAVDTGIPTVTVDETKLKSKVRQFVRRFRLAYAFEFHGRKYFANHGGVSALPNMTTISGNQLIRGVGGYDTEIDQIWEASYEAGRTQGYIQVHGHRGTTSTEHSISLEDNVEYGGNLVVLNITPEGHERTTFKNTVFKVPTEDDSQESTKPWIEDTENPITNKMIRNKYVKVKEQEGGILSLNFTEKAFKHKKWNEQTLTARGLFVDSVTGDIKLRSYNKFFNLNENKANSIGQLKETLAFPLVAYDKYNGFLGIASVVDGEMVLASKSTTAGPFKELFQSIYDELTPAEKAQLTLLSEKYNCSYTFEVMHTDDRHIIDFDKNRLVILDAVPNSYEFDGVDIDRKFSDMVLDQLTITSDFFSRKEKVAEFEDMAQLMRYVKEHTNDRTSEGLVLEDQKGFMFKVKYDYYINLKKLRGLKQAVQARYHGGSVTHFGSNAIEVAFAAWLAKKPLEYLQQTHIIDIFSEYESELGSPVL